MAEIPQLTISGSRGKVLGEFPTPTSEQNEANVCHESDAYKLVIAILVNLHIFIGSLTRIACTNLSKLINLLVLL